MTTQILTHPGYCPTSDLTRPDAHMIRQFIRFMEHSHPILSVRNRIADNYYIAITIAQQGYTIADIGHAGYKSNVMRSIGWPVDQVTATDFNFDRFDSDRKYKIITCFEILEHLQNPLHFLRTVKDDLLADGGSLFLSTPSRPKLFWTPQHYNEIPRDRLVTFLLEPLGLEIVGSRRVRIGHSWWWYLTGLRPLMRLWFGYTMLYEIKATDTAR